MKVEAVKEHEWLKRFVGEWTYEGSCPGEPGKEPMKFSGREVVRMIGDLWIVGESTGQMPGGGAATSIVTVGYNPDAKRFVGTWIGSMMAHLWVYSGWIENDDTLVLEAEGPRCDAPGQTALYRDSNQFRGNDTRIFRAACRQEDGSWNEMMCFEYRRAK